MASVATSKSTATDSEDPLVKAFGDGAFQSQLERQALSRLNRRLSDMPMQRRQEEAKEIVQKCLTAACAAKQKYDPQAGPVCAWVHGFLVNELRSHCRKLRKQPVQLDGHVGIWESIEEKLTDIDHSQASRLLDYLPADKRRMVEWYYLDELSYRQIGERLKIQEATARQQVRRAMKELRRRAQADEQEGKP